MVKIVPNSTSIIIGWASTISFSAEMAAAIKSSFAFLNFFFS